MPIFGLILPGEKGYVGWVAAIHGKEIPYGKFLGDIVNFLIVAAALFFFIVKFLGWIMQHKERRGRGPSATNQGAGIAQRDSRPAQAASARRP